jgi:threonine/homoserine/homoserine lactone efflux protein|tara:strand:- start:1208 stop:1837 length:630 start_codon:yes stop_codon:yes gene_type:complete
MTIESWVALTLAFILGAMSPGPSLATVLRNTLVGGKRNGILTATGHGLGFGVYSFIVVSSFASLLNILPTAEEFLRYAGIILLVYLAYIFGKKAVNYEKENFSNHIKSSHGAVKFGFVQGFLIALLNPKILAWMIAIYTPFINQEFSLNTVLFISLLGLIIDGSWYIFVATIVGNNSDKITSIISSQRIDGIMALLMLLFAGILAADLI